MLPLLVFLAGVLAHIATLNAPFIFDDGICIRENRSILSLARIGDVLWPPVDGSGVSGRPLVNLSLALNYAWGQFDPRGYHAFNILLHALVGGLLCSILIRSLGRIRLQWQSEGQVAKWLGGATALLWVVHPLQTESVACVIQRTEILGGFFYTLTVWAFVCSMESTRPRWWQVGAVAACLTGMAAKETMFTAPLTVLLLDRALWAGSFRAAWQRRGRMYVGLAATWLLLAWILFKMGGTRGNAAGFGTGVITWWSYFLRQWEAICSYLQLVFWPYPLVLDYGCNVVWSVREVAWQGVVLFTLGGLTVWGAVRNRVWALPAAFFFLILGPSSSVMPLPGQTMAEHRMYLPLAAVLVLAVVGAWRLGGRRVLLVLVVAVAAFATVSVARNLAYYRPLQLWLDVVRARPDNIRAYYNAGDAFFELGRWDEAEAYYQAALRIDPRHAGSWSGLGNVAQRRRNFLEAIRCYEQSIAIDPSYTDSVSNLGAVLFAVGRRDEGISQLRRLITLRPEFPNAYFNLGTALLMSGNLEEAGRCFETAIRLQPTHAEAQHNLGVVHLQSGHPREAERCFLEALRLRPDFPDAVQNLALVRGRR